MGRPRSAKPLRVGSTPTSASNFSHGTAAKAGEVCNLARGSAARRCGTFVARGSRAAFRKSCNPAALRPSCHARLQSSPALPPPHPYSCWSSSTGANGHSSILSVRSCSPTTHAGRRGDDSAGHRAVAGRFSIPLQFWPRIEGARPNGCSHRRISAISVCVEETTARQTVTARCRG